MAQGINLEQVGINHKPQPPHHTFGFLEITNYVNFALITSLKMKHTIYGMRPLQTQ